MSALQSLRDAGGVLRAAPWVVLAAAAGALIATLETAADSAVLSLLDLLVGTYVTAGIVGVALARLGDGRPDAGFFGAGNDYTLRLLGANLLAGVLALVVLIVPGAIAWGALRPELVALVRGGTPALGLDDAVVLAGATLAAFAVSLPFALIAPAVVDGHGITGAIGESVSRVAANLRPAVLFGLIKGGASLLAVGPGLYVLVASGIGDPAALASIDGTEFALLWAGGTLATSLGPVYAAAFYRRIGGRPGDRSGRTRAAEA